MTDTPISEMSFEAAMRELEQVVGKLERGDVALEESIALYERGAELKKRCEAKLKEAQDGRFRMIATDGVFSMDGDIAPLAAICDLAERYDALVMVDDSHATGFIGKSRALHCIPRQGGVGRNHTINTTLY